MLAVETKALVLIPATPNLATTGETTTEDETNLAASVVVARTRMAATIRTGDTTATSPAIHPSSSHRVTASERETEIESGTENARAGAGQFPTAVSRRGRNKEKQQEAERSVSSPPRFRSPYRSSNNNNRVASAFSIPSPPRQPRVEPRGDSRRGYDTYRAPAHVIPCIDEDTLPTPPRTSAPRPPYDALQRNVKVAREAPTVQSAYHAMASKYGEVTMVKLGNDEGTFAYVHFRYHREAGRCVAARQDTNWSTRVVTEEMGDSDWVDVRRGGARGYGGGRRGGRGREWRGNQGGNWGWGGPAPRERDDWRMDNRDDRGGEDDVPVRPHRESPPPDRADLDEI
ncbi:hypothetical protein FN846DRAFT_942643 [Sphaerosporella brunnea]|uniref:RRM domain-containing protein n=1 Tax=Sphaerosporella brunnea TaxID=1250544 RepID=A0A5J5F0N5_9PEZI|nr:hypothetical protein FN846DRAFT_942643 [Sphaerosporella brunnea]